MSLSVLVVCREGDPGMLGSFGRAFRRIGAHVHYWNLGAAIDRHTKYDRLGKLLASYFPVEPWLLSANRDLVEDCMALEPDVLLFAGQQPLRAGALAQIKAARPRIKIVMAWPDTLLNLTDRAIACLPMCDLVASYSQTAIPLLQRFGARQVAWVPFGVDPELFPVDVQPTEEDRRRFGCEIAFIANHRPSRERAVLTLLDAGIDVKVWGHNDWLRRSANVARAKHYFQGVPLVGQELVCALKCARASLNVIDPTNFPAANMRFFEQFACGVASLSSRCPEMEALFPDRQCVSYYADDQLGDKARELVRNEELRTSIAAEGHRVAMANHTYVHRARQLLDELGLISQSSGEG